MKKLTKELASMAVDGLLTAGLIKSEDFEKAVEIVEEEILVRLLLRDTSNELEKMSRLEVLDELAKYSQEIGLYE